MTTHLTDALLVELAESGQSHPHVAECERCRVQVAELRELLQAAGEADVPEPSPSFWEHFPDRVAAAVEAEPTPAARMLRMWTGAAAWRRVALVAAAILFVAGVTWRSGVFAPPQSGHAPRLAAVDAPAMEQEAPDTSDDDEAWALVTDAGATLDLDAAADAGFELQPGAAEMAAAQLSPDEQRELVRLLQAAVAQPES